MCLLDLGQGGSNKVQVGCILSLGSCHGIVLSWDGYKRAEVEVREGFLLHLQLASESVHSLPQK